MIVNTDSWHFKLNKQFWGLIVCKDSNLCRYFWMTAFVVLLATMLLSMWIGMLTIVVLVVWSTPFHERMIAAIVVLWCLGTPLCSFLAIKGFRKLIGTNTSIPTPSLLSEYIKAKKNKYCPIIEFKQVIK